MARQSTDTQRPNILWYCTDQQRFDTIAALGNVNIRTPNLDRFAGESTAFTHAYCQSPICTPSRASFLTGQYPSTINVNGNGNTEFPRHYESRLVPHRLRNAGYDCGLVGKLHLSSWSMGGEKRVDDGYRYFQYGPDHKGPRHPGHDYAEWLRAQGADADRLMLPYSPGTYRDGAKIKGFGGVYEPTIDADNIPPELRQAHWCTEKAIEFLNKNRWEDQPWMLSVNVFDPHPPFDAPREYYRRYKGQPLAYPHFQPEDLALQHDLADAGIDFQSRAQAPDAWHYEKFIASYYAMIEHVDDEFGRLLDHLDASGQRDNTVIIFMSDHGEMLCDHGLILKGCRFYEGLVRVPLLISWPEHFRAGVRCDALVELIDLAPTLYDVAGLDKPYYLQGRSLAPLLTGTAAHDQHRAFVRSEFYGAINYPDQTHGTMYRDERWKVVTYHGKDRMELYDLQTDPWEHNNLAGNSDCQDVLAQLVRKSFDATVFAHPPDPPRTLPF